MPSVVESLGGKKGEECDGEVIIRCLLLVVVLFFFKLILCSSIGYVKYLQQDTIVVEVVVMVCSVGVGCGEWISGQK